MKIMDNYNQPGFGNEQSENSVFGDRREDVIVVSHNAKQTLLSISKWAKFLAIVVIVVYALLLLFGLLLAGGMNILSSELGGDFGNVGLRAAGVFYIILSVILLYPPIKMLNYANYMKKAVTTNNQRNYEEALSNINTTLKFYGILTIIALIFWGFAIIFSIFVGAMI